MKMKFFNTRVWGRLTCCWAERGTRWSSRVTI